MTSLDIRLYFETRDREWAKQFLFEAHQANKHLYSSQESIDTIRYLFLQITDDISAGIVPEGTVKDYCYEILNYCDLSNDWRDWPRWAERINYQVELSDQIWLSYGLGRYLEESGQYAQSIIKHEEGLSLCNTNGYASSTTYWRGAHYLGMGIILQRINRFKEAESYLNNAVTLFKSEQYLFRQSDALANLASCYDRQDKHLLAIARYEESITVLRQIDSRFDLGKVLYSVGIAYTLAHKFISAQSSFQESQRLCYQTGNVHSLILSYYGMALLMYRLGKYNEAVLELEDAFKLFRKQNISNIVSSSFPETQGNMYLLTGAIYIKLREFDTALKYLEQAEELYKQIDNPSELLTKVLANRGRVYELLEMFPEAESSFLQLVANGKQLRSPLTCGDGGVHLLRIYQKRQATIGEWIKLIWRLEPYALYGTVLGLWGRRQHSKGLQKMKKNTNRT